MERTSPNGYESEYWIVFTQGKTHWITGWLKPYFSHIYLFTRDEYNWLVLNPTRLYLQWIIPPVSVNDFLPPPYAAGINDTVLKITFFERDDRQQYGSIGPLNCVTWAKYILGLRVWSFTPYSLYKTLIRFSTDQARMETHGIKSIEEV